MFLKTAWLYIYPTDQNSSQVNNTHYITFCQYFFYPFFKPGNTWKQVKSKKQGAKNVEWIFICHTCNGSSFTCHFIGSQLHYALFTIHWWPNRLRQSIRIAHLVQHPVSGSGQLDILRRHSEHENNSSCRQPTA